MQKNIIEEYLKAAITAFGMDSSTATISQINKGLINPTYKVSQHDDSILLQQLNSNVFSSPGDIVYNYFLIYSYLSRQNMDQIPAPLMTTDRQTFFTDNAGDCWRAVRFIEDTFTPDTPRDSKDAYEAARCYGNFTHLLSGFESGSLKTIIPKFHDLSFRYDQFIEAISADLAGRKSVLTYELEELKKRKTLVDFYCNLTTDNSYKQRVMHHDAKISNLLFDKNSRKVICPVDLDTVQAGHFFSDIGDMIRSMACGADENNTDLNSIHIRKDYYKAIIDGYLKVMEGELTEEEKHSIHYSGLLMIYMQSLRFMTDHLNGDIYYRIVHPFQNLERARNQLTLLQRLEEFIKVEFGQLADFSTAPI